MKKILILLMCFVLSSCGIGMFATMTENTVFLNEKDAGILKTRCKFSFNEFGCVKDFGDKYPYEQKLDKFTVTLNVNNGSKVKAISFGVLPLIPAPPIIPVFFLPDKENKKFCSFGRLKVNLSLFSFDYDITNIEIDLNNIYILKDGEKIYAKKYTNKVEIKHIELTNKNQYANYITIDFPIRCEETDNTLIFIEGVKVNGEEIKLPVGKIVYGSGWGFAMGYLC